MQNMFMPITLQAGGVAERTSPPPSFGMEIRAALRDPIWDLLEDAGVTHWFDAKGDSFEPKLSWYDARDLR